MRLGFDVPDVLTVLRYVKTTARGYFYQIEEVTYLPPDEPDEDPFAWELENSWTTYDLTLPIFKARNDEETENDAET